jgi:Flp pilus assembly secretin CpaC
MRAFSQNPLRPIILFGAAAAFAVMAAPMARSEPLVVPLDHSVRLTVAGAAQSVVVGNPTVADVTVVDSHTLFVSGRGYGVTDVVVIDSLGHTLYTGEIVVGTASTGRVSVWRGGARTDMACAPACQVSVRTGGGGSSGGSSGGSPAAPAPSLPGVPSASPSSE